ncbi:MAG TPA: tRNA uridine-5-carboxymethylaminomethyl(34) synthesis GTPase MnmE, partial [Lachnospiraceae bacterium]|nr:tRNA uridine-5-carboxymethylaminomethyl(34) synthesis GTPase MnmE [Lachnospiraceae bacterium]
MRTDTIAAVATSLSDAGIGIVRISGPDAVEVADGIFQTKGGKHLLKTFSSHTVHYGYIAEQGEILDEVMVSVMKAPKSYTREDTVEINCHGGVLLVRRVLEAVLHHGARLAEPGEFTKRAFLNGRIDLAKAEAVMDLIQAKNDFARKVSFSQLRGNISEEIKSLRKKILYEIAFIESALDDPEHVSLDGYAQKLTKNVDIILCRLKKLLDSADNGRMRKEGIRTVIVGKPNVGKSSFLNFLLGEERAIVTDVPGTTRDTLEEFVLLQGIGLYLVDTAGIRNTDDLVEKIGVDRAEKHAMEADLVVYVADTSRPLDEDDLKIIEMIKHKKVIVLFNKSDLPSVLEKSNILDKFGSTNENIRLIYTSTKDYSGLDAFADAVQDLFYEGKLSTDEEPVITSLRHKEAAAEAYKSLLLVKESLQNQMP